MDTMNIIGETLTMHTSPQKAMRHAFVISLAIRNFSFLFHLMTQYLKCCIALRADKLIYFMDAPDSAISPHFLIYQRRTSITGAIFCTYDIAQLYLYLTCHAASIV